VFKPCISFILSLNVLFFTSPLNKYPLKVPCVLLVLTSDYSQQGLRKNRNIKYENLYLENPKTKLVKQTHHKLKLKDT